MMTRRRKAISDIYYEAKMLHCAWTQYWEGEPLASGTPPSEPGDPKVWKHNFLLEATLIHTRAMLDFFEKKQCREGDMSAVDFDFALSPFYFSKELKNRINKRIAHITITRTEVCKDDRHWDFRSFLPPILERCGQFFKKLRDDGQLKPNCSLDTKINDFVEEVGKPSRKL